MNKFQEGSPRW